MSIDIDLAEAKRRARAGSSLLFTRRLIVIAVTMVSTFTVARLVPPSAYGLANMSTVLLAFAQIFRDFGLTSAIMRKPQVDQRELSFLFWVNAALTTGLSAAIALGAPAAARFYHDPAVMPVILVSLIGFLASGLSLQHVAILNRELRFGAVALIEIISLLTGFAVTLTLAFVRHDVWAIVVGTVVQLCVGGLLYVGTSRWRPGRPQRPPALRELLRFGTNTSLFTLSTFLSNNIAVILIGRFLGAGPLGQYNRAQALYALPTANLVQSIAQATMPLLTRLRAHPDEYRAAYVGLVRQVSAFMIPIAVVLAFAAVPLVQTLLGDRWRDAGLVLAALAPALAVMGLAYGAGDLFVTQNRSAELRTIGLIELVLRIGAVLIGVRFGLATAAVGFTLATFAAAALRVSMGGRAGPVGRADQLLATLPGVLIGSGAAIAGGAAWLWLAHAPLAAPLAAAVTLAAGGLGALIAGVALPPARAALIELGEVYGLTRVKRILSRRTGERAADRAISG